MIIHKDLGKRTLVMGILNVTPDSFSDGGQYMEVEQAVGHARRLIAEGADILDIGGESIRPGSEPVSAEEELARVLPVLRALQREGCPVPISIDTYKGIVAEEALKAGASIINDIWGGRKDPYLLKVAAEHKAPVILTHNRPAINYGPDFFADFMADMREIVRLALEASVGKEQIVLDPGIGFAKTREHNLELMARLGELVDLGYPVLLGASRKTFIRQTLQAAPDQVLGGTIATSVAAALKGVAIVRVHDVLENVKAVRMTDAIRAAGRHAAPAS